MKLLSLIFLLFNLPALHQAGYQGQGITIAVIDAGFFRANDPTVFPQDQILGTFDLLEGDTLSRDTFGLFDDPTNVHGTMVLSTMLYRDSAAGLIGTAPAASYYLIRSEDKYFEYPEEVDRLARAFMLADSLDVDIVTVSLGYSLFTPAPGDSVHPRNFTYAQMNGTSVAAQAATRLARNGRLVCVAAGNDGNKAWHYIATPADADSILTIGAIDSNDSAAVFSSYGPTADGRLKPEVSALGKASPVYRPNEQDSLGHYVGAVGVANGTSFATPETAGMAACLWQAMPALSAMQLRDLIIRSASLYPAHDVQLGYGVPDAWYAYSGERSNLPIISEWTDVPSQTTCKRIIDGRIVIIHNGQKCTILGLPIH